MSPRLLVGKDFFPSPTTFLQDLVRSLQDNADKIALEYPAEGVKYTYRELHEKLSGISAELHKLGVKDGDVVTVASHSTPEAIMFILGVWLSGAASASINPLIPVDEICYFLNMTKSKVVFVGEAFVEKMEEATKIQERKITLVSPNGKAPVNDFYKWIEKTELVTHVEQPLGKDHTVVICFTSGTTGQPKGAMIRDEYLKLCLQGMTSLASGDKVLLSGPLFWISSPLSTITALLNGFSLIQLTCPTLDQLLHAITTYKPTFWFSGTSVIQEMSRRDDLDRYDTSSLLRVVVGGSQLYSEQKRMVMKRVFGNRSVLRNLYGCTEVGLITTEVQEYPFDSPLFSAIGQPMFGITIKIVDTETGCLLGANTPGEICVKCVGIIKSYLGRAVTDKELDEDGFWHMGDIGYYDEQGTIHYQSRLKDVLKYREYMIAPAELEVVIQRHPDVSESAVVGKKTPEFGDIPTAFVVLKPGAKVTEQELSDFVAEQVIDQKRLRGGVYFINSLPKNAIGKIVRQDLVKRLSEQ